MTDTTTSTIDIQKIIQNSLVKINESQFDMQSFIQEFEKIPLDIINPKSLIKQIIDAVHQQGNQATYQKLLLESQKIIDWIFDNYCQKRNGIIEVLFFPSVESEQRVVHYLKLAKKSILIAMFTLSNNHLANTLRLAHEQGLDVRIITDDEFVDKNGSDIIDLSKEGISVRTDESKSALMHNKFAVLDDKYIITGSYNWTAQATNYNQENVIILEDSFAVKKYTDRFEELWIKFEAKNLDSTKGTGIHQSKLYEEAMKEEERKKQHEEKMKSIEDKKLQKEHEKLQKEQERIRKEQEKMQREQERLQEKMQKEQERMQEKIRKEQEKMKRELERLNNPLKTKKHKKDSDSNSDDKSTEQEPMQVESATTKDTKDETPSDSSDNYSENQNDDSDSMNKVSKRTKKIQKVEKKPRVPKKKNEEKDVKPVENVQTAN